MAGLDEGQQIPETISFQGNITYLLNDLITYDRAFFVGCIDKPRSTIKKKNIPEDQYWFAAYSKKTSTWSPAIPKNCKAKVLISEEWVNNNVPKFTGEGAYKYKPLPPLLELRDSEKFRDDHGNIHEVEVRGKKTKNGIRFKCKDIARVFEMESLDHNIRNIVGPTEYEVFLSPKNTGGNPTSTYLTYNGLLKVIFASRSGTASRFQDWATTIIYAAHLGTTEERVDVAANIIGVNAQMVKDVLIPCITSMPYVHLRSGTASRFQDWATTIIYAAHLGTTEERVDVAADIIGVNDQMVKDVLTACITSKKREEEYRNREEEYRKDFRRREEEYRKEIDRRRQRSGEHRREMDRMMDQLSNTTQQLSLTTQQLSNTTQQNKQYQDMLSKILTPDQCKELADRFAASVNL